MVWGFTSPGSKVGGYFSLPFEVKDGKAKITFFGSAKQVSDFIKLLEHTGVRHKVVSRTDAQFLSHSPLSHLTEKQQRPLITPHKLGYYDAPKE